MNEPAPRSVKVDCGALQRAPRKHVFAYPIRETFSTRRIIASVPTRNFNRQIEQDQCWTAKLLLKTTFDRLFPFATRASPCGLACQAAVTIELALVIGPFPAVREFPDFAQDHRLRKPAPSLAAVLTIPWWSQVIRSAYRAEWAVQVDGARETRIRTTTLSSTDFACIV